MGAERLRGALALGMVLLAGCADGARVEAGEAGRVERIADGDTLHLTDGRRVRLVQIDAPEPRSECWGREAAGELAALAPPGSEVGLARDPALDDRDRFGRLLRYVIAAGLDVNLALVERGAAAPYFFRGDRGRHADELLDAAKAAEAANRGLWGACPAARLEPRRALVAGGTD